MEYTLIKTDWTTIDEAVFCEEETSPRGSYLRDNSAFFLNETEGDLTLVKKGETPVGVGKFTVLPDGSGWLETLRIRPDYQGQGAGKSLYQKWLKEAETYGCPAIRMFTGTGNVRSKGLAEKYGLSLAGTYIGATAKTPEETLPMPEDFAPVTDFRYAKVLLESGRWENEDFVVMNNTFFRCGDLTWKYLFDKGMIWATPNHDFVVIGARMLRERGLHVAMYGGNGEKCMAFARAKAQQEGLPQVTVSYPPACRRIKKDMDALGFVHDASCRIVMERVF